VYKLGTIFFSQAIIHLKAIKLSVISSTFWNSRIYYKL